MTERRGRFQPISDVLAGLLDKTSLGERVQQARVIPEWPELVGPQIAQITKPLSIARDGTLFVAVRTNSWMTELSLMEPQLLAVLNGSGGRFRVRKIRWQLMR